MAKQNGVIKVKGTIEDLTFLRTQDGDLVKRKTRLDGSRLSTDPSFLRTRQNMTEFGAAATAGKLLRKVVSPMMLDVTDNRMISRITRQMTFIKNLDVISGRGKRSVSVGIALPEGKVLLKGLDFNIHSSLTSILRCQFELDPATGKINIDSFDPLTGILPPEVATHLSFSGAFAKVDFVTGLGSIKMSNVVNLPIDGTITNILLSPGVPSGSGTSIYLLKVVFFQDIGGIQYSMRDDSFNSMEIIEVA